jgi:hypothetical protein
MPSLPLPRFGFDEQNYAVVVAGRYLSPEVLRSRGHIKELEAFVRALAEKTALPLALVYLGTTINWTLEGDDGNPADPDVAAGGPSWRAHRRSERGTAWRATGNGRTHG